MTYARRVGRAVLRLAYAGAIVLGVAGRDLYGQDGGPAPPYASGQRMPYPAMPSTQPGAPYAGAEPSGAPSPLVDAMGQPVGEAGQPGAGITQPTGGLPGSAFQPSLAPEQFGALGGQTFAMADNVGYIDSAIIRSRFRVRYDSAYDNNRPDRAEFFYPKCGCFSMLPRNNPLFDPRALGPPLPRESRVDYQEVSPYLEIAANPRTSGFIEMPARFINPTVNRNAYGWSDLNLGFKHAFIANPNQFYTFQFRVYTPTGSGERGLGTNHASLEPGFLVFQRLAERLYLNGEVRDWIPVHATDFAGNVLRYGLGLTYNAIITDHYRIAPVSEFVGWSVLSGKKEDPSNNFVPVSAAGDTIVNAKIGLRIGLGNYSQAGGGSLLNDRHSFYVGYGRALTGDHWYKDILRAEYQFLF